MLCFQFADVVLSGVSCCASSFSNGHLLFLNWTLEVSQTIDAASELDLQDKRSGGSGSALSVLGLDMDQRSGGSRTGLQAEEKQGLGAGA